MMYRWWKLLAGAGTLALAAFAPAGAAGQSFAISHDGLECWPSDRYPVLSASLVPPELVQSIRIYFRSENYPDFYFVEAAVHPDGRVEAILPLAAPETNRVVYYIEAVSVSFESARTPEWAPEVARSDECRRRDPMLALFDGKVPDIVVNAVRAGAPALPPGFLAGGIMAAGTAGGIGVVPIVGVVAGSAAGGAVIVSNGNGNEETTSIATTSIVASQPTTSIASGSTSSVSLSTTTAVQGSSTTTTASITTTTASPGSTTTVSVPPTTTTAISTSTSAGTSTSTTTTSIPVTTSTTSPTTTTSAPASTSTTTSIPPTTTTAPAGADMKVELSAPGSVSAGSVIRYDVEVENDGPSVATGVQLVLSFPTALTFVSASSGSCTSFLGLVRCNFGAMASGTEVQVQVRVLALLPGTRTATASVSANEPDPVPGNNTDSETTNVTLFHRDSAEGSLRVAVRLEVPPNDGGDSGEVTLGSRMSGIDDTAPVELELSSGDGEYVLEAVLTEASGRNGAWRFELRPPPGVEVDGIRVEAGDPISLDARSLVFRVRGETGERVRFGFRLTPR
jgi:hypothetical protein